jgi:hypothetical protein
MSFDLLAYAADHRYRVRNLHDGRRVPPAAPPKHGQRGRLTGYCGQHDRDDAIIGKYGYVTDDGDGRIGWCLLVHAGWSKTAKLRRLAALGATIKQEGDTEAAGDAPVEEIRAVLRVIKAYRTRKMPPSEQAVARNLHAAGSGYTSGTPGPGCGPQTTPA